MRLASELRALQAAYDARPLVIVVEAEPSEDEYFAQISELARTRARAGSGTLYFELSRYYEDCLEWHNQRLVAARLVHRLRGQGLQARSSRDHVMFSHTIHATWNGHAP